ncbi:MAG TPA: amino acid adenylation domain-containing protein [Herpetosiphonaceae bacterium]
MMNDRCFHHLVEAQARRAPDAIAVVCGAETLTYAALDQRANHLAHHLRAIGVGGHDQAEDRVGLCVARSPDLVVGLLAILKAGAVYVPLDPNYPRQRLDFMLNDAQVRVLLTQQPLVAQLPPTDARILCLDTDWQEADTRRVRQPGTPPSVTIRPAQVAYMIYTSGSTGQPKGVLVPHRGLHTLAEEQAMLFGARPGSRVLQFASLSFDASIFEIVMALTAGATLHLAALEHLAPGPALTRLLREQAISHVTLPPSVLAALPDTDLPALQVIVSAGEACTAEIVERWCMPGSGRQFFNAYGPTETTIWATTAACDLGQGAPPIGRPIAGTHVYVLDHRLRRVPIGVPGELYIGGVGVARGYHNRPDLTAEHFVPHPFSAVRGERLYRTGDLVRYRRDGQLVFVGRRDQQVKIRGFRIEPGEIAAVLRQHPAVREAVVLARADHPGDQRLVAYVVEQTNQETETWKLEPGTWNLKLRAYLKDRLPDYMIPASFVVLDALPLTPNGKIDHAALPEPRHADRDSAASVAPRTPIEELLAGIWAEVLGAQQVGIHDHFFDLGGHSLLATQIVSRVHDVFGLDLPPRSVFESPTIAALAATIARAQPSAQERIDPPLLPIDRDRALPLSFAQQRLWVLHQLEPESVAYNIPIAVRLSGPLDTTALERSLAAIVGRHEILRTRFLSDDDRPVQVVAAEGTITLSTIDLRQLPPSERAIHEQRLTATEARQPFDLRHGPLLRATLLLLHQEGTRQEHTLLLTLHHIVADGWSMGVLVRELAALYTAFTTGSDHALGPVGTPLPIQYADFAYWQRQWLAGERLEAQLGYWRRQLRPDDSLPLPRTEIPTDRPHTSQGAAHAAQHPLLIPAALHAELVALSRREGVTLFMTLLTALHALLHWYTRQDQSIVGTDIANRNRPEIEPLIGFFVNVLVLRTSLAGNPTLRELMRRVRETTLEAYAHQDLPFEQLVEELQPERDLSRSPFFQIIVVLQNTPMPDLQLHNLHLAPVAVDTGSAKFDLVINLSETPTGMRGSLIYKTALFDATTLSRFAAQFEMALKTIAAQPDMRLGELVAVLTEAEQQHAKLLRQQKLKHVRRKTIGGRGKEHAGHDD